MPGTSTWTTPDAARDCIRRGFCPVPFPRGAKGPTVTGWTNWRFTEDDVLREFRPDHNMGIRLGDDVGRLVCVDLDCPEALALAPDFLLPTPAVLGRPNRPASHWLYRVTADGGTGRSLRDRLTNKPIVEVLYNGRQVVVGPSVHPDDGDIYDSIDFTLDDVPVIPRRSLDACVEALHDACLQTRYADDPRKLEQARNGKATSTPTVLPAVPADPDGVPYDQRVRRGEAYAANTPGAISGSGGHNQTYALATALVHGLCLSPDDARNILAEYNLRCEPPWSDRELDHKIEEAASKNHERPRGWLLAESQRVQSAPMADLSGIRSQMAADPRPVTFETQDPGELPDHMFDVPGFIDDVMQYTLATAVHPNRVFAFCGALSLQALLASRRVRTQTDNRPNLYVLALANSGVGKNRPRQVNTAILSHAGLNTLAASEFSTGQGMEDRVAETGRVLYQTDEIDDLLQRMIKSGEHYHSAALEKLLNFYSESANELYMMRSKARQRNEVSTPIDQPHLNVFGTAVPNTFYESLTERMLTKGLLARMLVFDSGRRARKTYPTLYPIPDTIIERARLWGDMAADRPDRLQSNLAHRNAFPRTVACTPDALEAIRSLGTKEDSEYASAEVLNNTAAMAVWARLCEKAEKLALLHACSRSYDDPLIDAAAVEWASEVVLHQTRRMLFLSSTHFAENESHHNLNRVREIIRKRRELTKTELVRLTPFLKGRRRERDEILCELMERGEIDIPTPTTSGGRPLTIIRWLGA
jgi:hypothetical protein